MIKDPQSEYEFRRSFSLLKVKKFDDAEATVIGHERGTGRCSDMCGAIIVRGDDGIEFKIGSGFTDA
jgi:DNA ligase-1